LKKFEKVKKVLIVNVYQVTGVLAVVSVQKNANPSQNEKKKLTLYARCSIPVSKVTLVER
jgi:hypothetical protein